MIMQQTVLLRRFLFGAAAISAWYLPTTNADDDCNAGEQRLEFTFFLDEDSVTENGWSLTCDEEGAIWQVPVGTLQSSQGNVFVDPDTSAFVSEHICLPEDFTCHFTLEDTFGDGLLFPGHYYLIFGATTIAVSQDGEEFHEKTFCFGPNCSELAQEIKEECDYVYFNLQADDYPEEISVEITCNGTTLFSKSEFTTPGESTEFEHCLSRDQCCTLSIHDSARNGLSSLQEGGTFLLEWANQVIISYDATNDFKFDTLTRNFGSTCPNVDPNPTEDGPTHEDLSSESDTTNANANANANSSTEQDMAKDSDGMSSTIKIGLAFFAILVFLGVVALLMARFVYTTKTDGKALEIQSVSSDETKQSEDDF